MLDVFFLILCSAITLLILLLFFYYYGLNIRCSSSNLHEFSLIAFTFIPILMGVCILPFEISKYFQPLETPPKTDKALLAIQYIFYYITLIISFFLNPFLMEFKRVSEDSDQPLKSRLIQAFKKVFLFYIILGALALVGFIILIASGVTFDISLILGILPSITNMYGLIMYMITIGIGIIKIPLTIWHKANPINVLRDTLIELEDISEETPEQSTDENNHSRYYNSLLIEGKRQLDNVIELDIKQNRKKIIIRILKRSASILSGLFLIIYIVFECSFAFRNDRKKFVLNIILTKINNQPLNQLFLFIFIGLMVSIGAYVFTCINFGSLLPEMIRGLLAKFLNIFDYKFVKGETVPKTFQYWSTYLQRLVPTIAYHCQRLAGAEESSLERIMGQLDQFYFFSKLIRMILPPFLLIIVMIYFISIMDEFPDEDKIRRGYRKLKDQMFRESNLNLDNYIVYDILNRDDILESLNHESNNNLEIQLSSTSTSFHDAPIENSNNIVL